MKILYTLGNYIYSGHQVICYTINNKNESVEDFQKETEKCFAASLTPKNLMFKKHTNLEGMDAEPPIVGDVIWTHTSGNQYIAAGIWQETPTTPINFDALRFIMRSVKHKAEDLGQLIVSMPLLTRDHDLNIWNFIYPIIEDEFRDADIQVIVHIPTEEELLALLDNIGGEFDELKHKPTEIRFAQSKK